MKIVLLVLSTVLIGLNSLSQLEIKNLEKLENKELKSLVKDKHPTVYLLDGEFSSSNHKIVSKVYADARSVDLLDRLPVKLNDQAVLIVRIEDFESSIESLSKAINNRKGDFALIHFIFENECAITNCFSKTQQSLLESLVDERGLIVTYEYEINQ